MATSYNKIPVAFAAPAQQQLFLQYGDPRKPGWEAEWMQLWEIQQQFQWFPRQSIYIHKDFRLILAPALQELTLTGGSDEIKTFDGCFNIRHVRGGYSVLSVHSWGAAIDLNARDNPMATGGNWSDAFIATMERYGIYCGQAWNGRKDPMHFSMVNG